MVGVGIEPPFKKGDRVRIPASSGFLDRDVVGTVRRCYSCKPRGKLAGWWLLVWLDPPPGIRTWVGDVKIHTSLVERL